MLDRHGLTVHKSNLGIDGDERGVGREEVVTQPEAGHFFHPLVIRPEVVVVREKGDSVARPKVS